MYVCIQVARPLTPIKCFIPVTCAYTIGKKKLYVRYCAKEETTKIEKSKGGRIIHEIIIITIV